MALLVLIYVFGIAGCGKVKEGVSESVREKIITGEAKEEIQDEIVTEDTNKGVQEEVVTEGQTGGKIFYAEDLVTIEEMSAITGVPIVDITLWDNDFYGMLGATYYPEKDEDDGVCLICNQQAYRGAADEDVARSIFSADVKKIMNILSRGRRRTDILS